MSHPFLYLGAQVTWIENSDLSKGKEQHQVPVFGPVDGHCPMMPFTYITKSILSNEVVISKGMEAGCTCCTRSCILDRNTCECAVKNGGQLAYSLFGRLAEHMLHEVR